jgi:hypothetical protein
VFVRGGTFYSCWLPTRLRTTLGPFGAVIPNRPLTLAASPVRINGNYVAFFLEGVYDPGVSGALVLSVNARTGHTARIVQPREAQPREGPGYNSSLEDVGVAADGAPVYLQREGSPCPGERLAVIAAEWRATVDSRATRTLDCEVPGEPAGSISQLAVHGQTVTWMHAGARRTATLP